MWGIRGYGGRPRLLDQAPACSPHAILKLSKSPDSPNVSQQMAQGMLTALDI